MLKSVEMMFWSVPRGCMDSEQLKIESQAWALTFTWKDVILIVMSFAVVREIVDTMVQAYSQKIFNGQLPVFDGRRNLYSREPLPIGREKVRLCFNIWKLIILVCICYIAQ